MLSRLLPCSALLLLIAGADAAAAADLTGRLSVLEGGKRSTPELRQAVIYFVPQQPPAFKPLADVPEVVMKRKAFEPRVLAVATGSKVRFPNNDPILHNAFSVSRPNDFDLGLYREGDAKEVVFKKSGVVTVFCNVHHAMIAYVLVLDTPHFAQPERDGSFRLTGLPAGAGTVTVWHERAEPWTRQVELPASAPLEVRIELTKPKVQQHLNKFGKPYERDPRGRRYR